MSTLCDLCTGHGVETNGTEVVQIFKLVFSSICKTIQFIYSSTSVQKDLPAVSGCQPNIVVGMNNYYHKTCLKKIMVMYGIHVLYNKMHEGH
jgi:hypothetical protein